MISNDKCRRNKETDKIWFGDNSMKPRRSKHFAKTNRHSSIAMQKNVQKNGQIMEKIYTRLLSILLPRWKNDFDKFVDNVCAVVFKLKLERGRETNLLWFKIDWLAEKIIFIFSSHLQTLSTFNFIHASINKHTIFPICSPFFNTNSKITFHIHISISFLSFS